MPEGDILRRTAARLDQALAGRVVRRAELRWPDAGGVELAGRTVLGTRPYGKHLLTRFDDGRTLHTHLRMDGSWRVGRTGSTGRGSSATRGSARCSPPRTGRRSGCTWACSTCCAPTTSRP